MLSRLSHGDFVVGYSAKVTILHNQTFTSRVPRGEGGHNIFFGAAAVFPMSEPVEALVPT